MKARTDAYFWTRRHDVAIEITSDRPIESVAPLADDFAKFFGDVRVRRVSPVPETGATSGPGWDYLETIAVTLIALGGAEFVREIVGSLADDTYRELRRSLLKSRSESAERERYKTGLRIEIGADEFVFDQAISDAEFAHQLGAAQRIVDREAWNMRATPENHSAIWLWDKTENAWRQM